MNNNDNNINISLDMSPYIPDINVNGKIYNTSDNISLESVITTYQTIFIFNLHYDTNKTYNIYNNPSYMLYGITNNNVYYLPSLLFFKNIKNTPYKTIKQELTFSLEIKNLLVKIGYNIDDIVLPNTGNNLETDFCYQSLSVSDITERTSEILFLFFYVNNQNTINNNKYNSTVFHDKNYFNVLLYPYVTNFQTQFIYDIHDLPQKNEDGENNINSLYFNERDLCQYIDKLDYKYLENKNYLNNQLINLDKIKNYSLNLKFYENYVYKQIKKYKNVIFIDINEITKLNYNEISKNNSVTRTYQSQQESYTDTLVLNKHVNNNKIYSNINQKTSLTLDNKLSFIKNNIDAKYTPYILNFINNNNLYPISKNYFINTYININNPDITITNLYLYKICLLINPKIIYQKYLIESTSFEIKNLLEEQNMLFFGINNDKNILYLQKNINHTDTYYINKYKITFTFLNENKNKNEDKNITYIIILSIAFYNNKKIKIININKTETINDLGYTNYTYLDETLTIAPCIYNTSTLFKIYENIIDYGLLDTKYYSYTINYDNISKFIYAMNGVNMNSFYHFVSNIKPNIHKYSNTLNTLKRKINNLIDNIILLSQKFNAIKDNIMNLRSIMHIALTIDTNIDKNYIDIFVNNLNIQNDCNNLFPIINCKKSLNNNNSSNNDSNSNNNNINNNNNNIILPNGTYKIFKFHNYNPSINFLNTSLENDKIVYEIDTINEYTKHNFCILIKISKQPHKTKIKTKFYMCICYNSGTPYITTDNKIYAFELFNYYNEKNKIIINLIVNKYVNFYQMNFVIEQYNVFNEFNTLVINFDNLYFKKHEFIHIHKIIKNDHERFDVDVNNDAGINFNTNADINTNTDTDINTDTNTNTNTGTSTDTNTYVNNLLQTHICKKYKAKTLIKNIICILNQYKNLYLTQKIIFYLKQLKIIKIHKFETQNYLNIIDIIRTSAQNCITNNLVNYNLNVTYSNTSSFVQNTYYKLAKLTTITTLNVVNSLEINCEIIINYIKKKISLLKSNIENDNKIIGEITYNYIIFEYLNVQFENIFKTEIDTNSDVFQIDKQQIFIQLQMFDNIGNGNVNNNNNNNNNNNIANNLQFNKINLNIIKNVVNIIKYNSLVLTEIIYKFVLIIQDKTVDTIFNNDSTNDNLHNIIENTKIYKCNFDIFKYLNELKINLNQDSNTDTNLVISIDNLKNVLQNIINTFIGIYKFNYNITTGTIQQINPQTINVNNLKLIVNDIAFSTKIINDNTLNNIIENIISNINEYILYLQYDKFITNMYNTIINSNININISQDINTINLITNIYEYVQLQKMVLQFPTEEILNKYYLRISNMDIDINNVDSYINYINNNANSNNINGSCNDANYSNNLSQFINENLKWNLQTKIEKTKDMLNIIKTTNLLNNITFNFNEQLNYLIINKKKLNYCKNTIGYADLQLLYLNIEEPI